MADRYERHTPSPKLRVEQRKNRKASAPLHVVFVGLAIEKHAEDRHECFLVIHDGVGAVQTHQETLDKSIEDTYEAILELLIKYSTQREHRIGILSLSPAKDPTSIEGRTKLRPGFLGVDRSQKPSFLGKVWLQLDAIPFVVSITEPVFSLQSRAVAAIEKALALLNPMSASTLKVGTNAERSVSVDADFQVHLYDLAQQAAITSPQLWKVFATTGQRLLDRKTRIHFFSATPSGGGVALMRHGLRRLWFQAGLDVNWFVPQGDSNVFNITKRKMHNVLQGVAGKEVMLNAEDKKLFETWTNWNFKTYWSAMDGPLWADIIVIDDPQLTALIPIIKRCAPHTKIVFRCHIEVRGDLLEQQAPQITETWSYLWSFIKQADLFVAHPVKYFVPKEVKDNMTVVYMPPATDLLDGLNKPIPNTFLNMYRHEFDEALTKSKGGNVDWNRPYITQIARFDPSKGIPDLVEGYRLFRKELDSEQVKTTPQLILTGHTSVDDPDSTRIINALDEQIFDKSFDKIRDDIFAVRSPPSDRLLNAILRGADVACQVSTREGYEIKVSEALHKDIWVIAAKAGGLPLQCRDGVDSTLVEPGNPQSICDALLDFYSTKEQSKGTSCEYNNSEQPVGGRFGPDGKGPSEENFTVANATMWHTLWLALLNRDGDFHRDLNDKFVWKDFVVKAMSSDD